MHLRSPQSIQQPLDLNKHVQQSRHGTDRVWMLDVWKAKNCLNNNYLYHPIIVDCLHDEIICVNFLLCRPFMHRINSTVNSKHIWLTHWGRVTHICISDLTSIGSDNGLLPVRCQAIMWTSPGILLIGPLGTIFNEISNWIPYIFIQENAFGNVVWKMVAILSRPQCVNQVRSSNAWCHHESWSTMIQVMACILTSKPLPELILIMYGVMWYSLGIS